MVGRQTSATFTGGAGVLKVYGKADRLTSSSNTTAGTSRTLAYEYDANGNRTKLTFPDAAYFTTTYDNLNRASTIAESGGTQLASFSYDALGRRSGLSRSGGVVSSAWTYDAASRLRCLTHDLTGGGTALCSDSTLSASGGDMATRFAYNPAGQIVTREAANDAYAYTAASNVSRSYTPNGLNQYSDITVPAPIAPQYDANGNMTFDGATTLTYDGENRLTDAAGYRNVALAYDPLGRLFQTSGPAGTTQFLYDGDALVAEYDGAGTLKARYVHGPGIDEPLVWYVGAAISAPTRRYLAAEHQGSIVTIADGTGALIQANAYDPYGVPMPANLGRFAYTGQIVIPELGMYHYKARIYSPKLGWFLQTDPVGYQDQINLYAYVANDPVNHTDPTGMRDIYIGGADDKDATRIVQAYAERQMRLHPDRDIQYFSWADKKGIAAALERGIPIKKGYSD